MYRGDGEISKEMSDKAERPLTLTTIRGLLGDALLRPIFPLIFLRHLCIFLLIVTSPRRSALAAPIPESDGRMT